jgi:hypothetical protein
VALQEALALISLLLLLDLHKYNQKRDEKAAQICENCKFVAHTSTADNAGGAFFLGAGLATTFFGAAGGGVPFSDLTFVGPFSDDISNRNLKAKIR